jgi:hypothetical protein
MTQESNPIRDANAFPALLALCTKLRSQSKLVFQPPKPDVFPIVVDFYRLRSQLAITARSIIFDNNDFPTSILTIAYGPEDILLALEDVIGRALFARLQLVAVNFRATEQQYFPGININLTTRIYTI